MKIKKIHPDLKTTIGVGNLTNGLAQKPFSSYFFFFQINLKPPDSKKTNSKKKYYRKNFASTIHLLLHQTKKLNTKNKPGITKTVNSLILLNSFIVTEVGKTH